MMAGSPTMAEVRATPWTVHTKKPVSAPPPRKRQRVPTDSSSGTEEAERKRKRRQQTLTQIEFVPRVEVQQDEEDLHPIGVEPRAPGTARTSRTAPRRRTYGRRSTSKFKRNSTLTQMDFLNGYRIFDDEDKDNGTQLLGNDPEQLPQVDGAADRPRRMPVAGPSSRTIQLQDESEKETQKYQPRSKKRRILQEGPVQCNRRTSARLATTRARRSGAGHEAVNDQENEPPSSQESKEARTLLATPSKPRYVIPSSQSPESLPPSTRKKPSANLELAQRRSPMRKRLDIRSSMEASSNAAHPMLQSPKRKVCILRDPAEEPQHIEAVPSPIKRTNHSIWTPPTSSPVRNAQQQAPKPPLLEIKDSAEEESSPRSQHPPVRRNSDEQVKVKESTTDEQPSAKVNVPEIPETSQYETGNGLQSSPIAQETQGTLPSLNGLLGLTDPIAPEQNPVVTPQMLRLAEAQSQLVVAVRDSANPSEPPDSTDRTGPQTVTEPSHDDDDDDDDDALLAPVQENIKPNASGDWDDNEEDEGVEDDFGTPIANDTQFNFELSDRLASSSRNVSPSRSPVRLTQQEAPASASQQLEHELTQALPTPRLVHAPSIQTTTQSIPLNDIVSPTLPSRHTQRVVYPASLPRQSQVSTQDPTQPYRGTSSMQAPSSSFPARQQPATIRIKDSSSMHVPLHDIPSQRHSQPRNIVPASDDDDDLDMADDLDAPHVPPVRQPAPDRSFGQDEDDEDSQVLPPQPARAREASPPKAKKPRLTKPRRPVLNTQVRALIGSSCLDAIPDPPGWSQRSFDDELI